MQREIPYTIQTLKETEYNLLRDFLYEAIYVPDGMEPPPISVLDSPYLQPYIAAFGNENHDIALSAVSSGEIAGIIWARIMHDYGHIDDQTPSLAMAVKKAYRQQGIGTALLQALLRELKIKGYKQISLSVQKENYAAIKLYKKAGFCIFQETQEEYIMTRTL